MTDVAELIGTAEVVATTDGMDRADWLDHRRRGIGGSDAPAIAGVSRYKSPFEVWLEKVDAPTGDDEDSEAALWGRLLEDVVADEVARREDIRLDPVRAILASPDHPFMLANIDRAAHDPARPGPGVYEGKTAGHFIGPEWDDNAVPLAYVIQGMHYLAVTGWDWLLYGVLIGGQRLEIRRVERDPELIEHLIDIEASFWELVDRRTPPDPDGSKACTEFVSKLHKARPGVETTVDADEVLALLAERDDADEHAAIAKERRNVVDNKLKLLAAEAEVARADDDGRILFTYKEVPASSYTVNRKAHRRLDIKKSAR